MEPHYFIRIQEELSNQGYSLRKLKGKLVKYLIRNQKAFSMCIDSQYFELRNGLEVILGRGTPILDGKRTLDMRVYGEDHLVVRGVESMRRFYLGPIKVEYTI